MTKFEKQRMALLKFVHVVDFELQSLLFRCLELQTKGRREPSAQIFHFFLNNFVYSFWWLCFVCHKHCTIISWVVAKNILVQVFLSTNCRVYDTCTCIFEHFRLFGKSFSSA